MTIDEAIIHAESEVWKNEREADRCSRHGGSAYEEKAKSCRACANEHRQLAEWLKELKAYRKTYPYGVEGYPPRAEPSNSEKPNNCDEPQLTPNYCGTCKHREVSCGDLPCDVCHGYSNYEPKDEPTISKMEQVEDEPQIFICPIQNDYEALIEDEPQTDCAWK